MFLIFERPIQILFRIHFVSVIVLLGTSDWINSDNLLPRVNRSTATKRIANTVTRCDIYLIFCNTIKCSSSSAYGLIIISIVLCFSSLQWLTRDFKYITFRDQWIPLNSIWSFTERTRPKKVTSQKRKTPTTTGRGLTRSTLTASACVRLYNISKLHAFRMFYWALEKKNGAKNRFA